MKRFLANLALLLFAAGVVVPLVWILLDSFKESVEVFSSVWGIPKQLKWANYQTAWTEAGLGRAFFNSLKVCVGTLVILLPIGSMAAYVFAKYRFKGSGVLFGGFLGGMMFPNFLVIVPLYFLMHSLHLYDDLYGLILVYVAYSLSFTVFVMTGFFQALPNDLIEAAQIDGCGHARTFWSIMFPLVRPGIVVVGIFNAIGLWNEFGLALVLLPGADNRTLPLGIYDLAQVQHYQSDWGALFAGLVIVMTPVLIVYWMFRDKIHETMLAGAIKG